MKKHSSLQNKLMRNYDNYDSNKKTGRLNPKSAAMGDARRKVEDMQEKKEFEAMFDLF